MKKTSRSTGKSTEEFREVNNDLLLTQSQRERNTTYLLIKLNRLQDKQARFVSHKEFITGCVLQKNLF